MVIKLTPEDIYLKQGAVKQGKPSTSGATFRRPLSRNHPILNLGHKSAATEGKRHNTIKVVGPGNSVTNESK